jgi:hypothetical protein
MVNAVVADFESIFLPNSKVSYVHTISCIPVTMKTGKMSRYMMHTEKGLVIKIANVLNNKFVKEFLDAKGDTIHVQKKHENDTIVCKKHGIKIIRHMRFHDAIKTMNKFILQHGGMLLSHNLPSDLAALVSTQNLVKGPRIIKNKLVDFPNTGMYDNVWKQITLVCTMSLLCNRCHKMNIDYKKWAAENGKVTGMNKLESFTQFVKNDRTYKQSHAAVQDTIDLFTVLIHAHKCDGPILDGFSYLNEPKWVRAV